MQNENTKKIVTGLVVLVVLFGVVYFLGASRLFGDLRRTTRNPEVVNELVREIIAASPAYTLSGTITGVSARSISIDVPHVFGASIPRDADLRTREVMVDDLTQIFSRIRKSDAEIAPELAAYRAKKGPPPAPYAFRATTLADLKVGDIVTVKGGAGVEIGSLPVIDAAEIIKTNQ